ncbi:MAG: hypothetical protein JW925_12405 [Syntrophaceae bacterium]|nr:hypothetical protein [Syntrophaceae bacterium]
MKKMFKNTQNIWKIGAWPGFPGNKYSQKNKNLFIKDYALLSNYVAIGWADCSKEDCNSHKCRCSLSRHDKNQFIDFTSKISEHDIVLLYNYGYVYVGEVCKRSDGNVYYNVKDEPRHRINVKWLFDKQPKRADFHLWQDTVHQVFKNDLSKIKDNDLRSILEEIAQNPASAIQGCEERVARLTWNTNGWVHPSGPFGKSKDDNSHEAKYGYGHEEWLFDTSKIIDGFHYGFLEPIRKQQDTYANKSYNIWLYTIDGITKKRYWVGWLQNVEVIDGDRAEKTKRIYKDNGWLNEMEKQIIAAEANKKGFSNWKGIDLFNIRFKMGNYKINDPYFELPRKHQIYGQSRYAFVFFKDEFNLPDDTGAVFKFDTQGDKTETDNDNEILSTSYIRTPKSVEVTHLHAAISKALARLLKRQFGKDNVSVENQLYKGMAKRVDIVVRDSDKRFIFYEIKTYNSVWTSIREAIGQLIEYAYCPDKENAKELIIVTQKTQEIERIKTYLSHLRRLFKMSLYYQWFDLENNTVLTTRSCPPDFS